MTDVNDCYYAKEATNFMQLYDAGRVQRFHCRGSTGYRVIRRFVAGRAIVNRRRHAASVIMAALRAFSIPRPISLTRSAISPAHGVWPMAAKAAPSAITRAAIITRPSAVAGRWKMSQAPTETLLAFKSGQHAIYTNRKSWMPRCATVVFWISTVL